MKRKVLGCLTMALLAAVSSLAEAQPPRGAQMGRGGMILTELISQKSVQEELKLTEDQVKSVTELAKKQRESTGQGLRDLKPEERLAKIQERIKEQETALGGVIGAEQLSRLKQISLQTRGVAAFSDPTVVTALSITDEQKEKFKAISAEEREARSQFDRDNPEASRAKIAEARKAAKEKALAVLTAEQAAKWKEMTGTPFTGEIRFQGRGGGRRGGGNRPPGNSPPPDQA